MTDDAHAEPPPRSSSDLDRGDEPIPDGRDDGRDNGGDNGRDDGDGGADDLPTVADLIHAEAQSLVRGNVIAAMAIGLVPVPVVDVASVVGLSVRMVHGLSQCYGVPFSNEAARAALIALIPAVLPVTAVGSMASAVKSVPIVGSVVGAGGVSLLSGAVVYALGQVFIRHYERGGTLHDIKLDAARAHFKSALAQGRQVASRMRDRVDGVGPRPAGSADAARSPAGEHPRAESQP
ncbi:DUF697 domain-containing protein [Roseospira visakhapatnamensis]|uniref:Uncharacterized protein (DUF697 family) n=1 Tax=Roseospira visakhapatnamensis TaxID=390880 RepID=A0A7W6R9V8_9PROT|nr:DUF697 domain-containing protein [Roseospira visakhapatnamensis]MBB4264594.1 uncharacterized protein (DUF697 family) [Roseospira visakhapatnamensis]